MTQQAPNSTWAFANPVKIFFGAGILQKLPETVTIRGEILLLTSPGHTRRGLTERITGMLPDRKIRVVDSTTPNPQIEDIRKLLIQLEPWKPDAIVAAGGGSVIDTAKAIAFALGLKGNEKNLKEILKTPTSLHHDPITPVVAIPTTSGTGSEVTPFATLWDLEEKRKYSIDSPRLFPAAALVDPELTYSLPLAETAATALDAFAQAFDSLANRRRTPISELFARASFSGLLAILPEIEQGLRSPGIRELLSRFSLLSGLAISQSRTSLSHAISYPLTAHHRIPHGAASAFVVPQLADCLGNSSNRVNATLLPSIPQDVRKALCTLVNQASPEFAALDTGGLGSLVPEMNQPGRADNFPEELSTPDLESIIARALNDISSVRN